MILPKLNQFRRISTKKELLDMDEHAIPPAIAREVLCLGKADTLLESTVKAAYRAQAKKMHPDVVRNRGENEEIAAKEFQLLQRCYAVLRRTAQHDETRASNAAGRDAWKQNMRQKRKRSKKTKS